MKMSRAEDGRVMAELGPEEALRMRQAIQRLTQTFVQTAPVLTTFLEGLKSLQPELDRLKEVCQRLDPAFAGPADEESFPIRQIDPVTGASKEVN